MPSIQRKPRLPLEGSFDLTYRCNNNCRHCWLCLSPSSERAPSELGFGEIRRIVDEARKMGCQSWILSGGEPLLRPDFEDIFSYVTQKAVHYSLNTNGTRITPDIAGLLTRKGRIMVSIYGATAEIHDHVTRNPGSFEAALRGMRYLQEAGAEFIVQIVPMRANFHELDAMKELAHSMSPQYRLGAAWLWLTGRGAIERDEEIREQRLSAEELLKIDPPSPSAMLRNVDNGQEYSDVDSSCRCDEQERQLFQHCLVNRNAFHLDPYGAVSFCCFITDPDMRMNLRHHSFVTAWDEFIPSLVKKTIADREFFDRCGVCDQRVDCRWCPVYAYLEHGRYSAGIDYLCEMAAEAKKYKEDWQLNHIQYFQIAGITIRISADVALNQDSFTPVLNQFRVDGPGIDTITLHLATAVPQRKDLILGEEVYRVPPWAIYRQNRSWIYLGITSEDPDQEPYCAAIWDEGHSKGTIFRRPDVFNHTLLSLTTFSSDQILISQVLAHRQACYLHSAGIVIDGKGYLFVGHSEAGKSTMMKMLRSRGEILCDDRIVVRRWPDGFRIHGTWSHGEIPDVSPGEAPLQAILFLEKDVENKLIQMNNRVQIIGALLSHVIKSLVTADWWEKVIDLAEQIADEVPVYRLRFNKSGRVADLLDEM